MGSKDQLSKQAERKQNHSYGDHLEGYQTGGGRGSMGAGGGEGAGINKYKLVGPEETGQC